MRSKQKLPPTLGGYVCDWIEKNLVHGEGDYVGKPFRLRSWQRAFIYRAYELRPDGDRQYRRALWGLPSGNGKTEIAAALACAELAGPVICAGFDSKGNPIPDDRPSPDIPVAAASFDQADLLFGAARLMLGLGPLGHLFDIMDTEILWRDRPGRMYRVAAKAGTNDGKRPSFFVADEVHEWVCTCGKPGGIHVRACKARVYTVLSKGRAKRRGAWELAISTAGWDMESLLGDLYRDGVDGGDPRFLFAWQHATDSEFSFSDKAALKAAVTEANPAIADFLSMENVLADARQMPEFEFRRYHLNQWVTAPDRWIPPEEWNARAVERDPPPKGTKVVLGFDGSYAGDSTALVGATVEQTPHIFVIDAWEKDPTNENWRVDVMDVEAAVQKACDYWQVQRVGCDPYRWQRSMAALEEKGLPIAEWPSHQPARMVPACAQFYDAVTKEEGGLTHDGDERLTTHLQHCVVKIDSRGPRITKDHKDSVRRIDLAVAAVIAFDLAYRERNTDTGWLVL